MVACILCGLLLRRQCEELLHKLNMSIPDDISIRELKIAPPGFHAKDLAKGVSGACAHKQPSLHIGYIAISASCQKPAECVIDDIQSQASEGAAPCIIVLVAARDRHEQKRCRAAARCMAAT